MTISESIIASTIEGASESQAMSDIEKAARAIVARLGLDADALASNWPTIQVTPQVWLAPPESAFRPLWTFFIADADAALSVLDF